MTPRTQLPNTTLSTAKVSYLLGIKPPTWRSYVSRGLAPEPNGYHDLRTPYWYLDTILMWDKENGNQYPNIPYAIGQMNLKDGCWKVDLENRKLLNKNGTLLLARGKDKDIVSVRVDNLMFQVSAKKVISEYENNLAPNEDHPPQYIVE